MKRLWTKNDTIVPTLRKCPTRDIVVLIVKVEKDTYKIKINGKQSELEHKYLEGSYISETEKRIYNWTLLTKGEENVSKTNTSGDKGTRSKRKGKTKADNPIQEDSSNGSVRKRSRRTNSSGSVSKKSSK